MGTEVGGADGLSLGGVDGPSEGTLLGDSDLLVGRGLVGSDDGC